MTLRTHRETLTFAHPFTLSGVEDVQAPGAYTVQTDEELLEGLSFLNPVYFENRSFSSSGSSWSLTQRRSASAHGSWLMRTSKSATRRIRSSPLAWQ